MLSGRKCQHTIVECKPGLYARAELNETGELTVDTTVEPLLSVVVSLMIAPPLASVAVLLPPELPLPAVLLPPPEPPPVRIPVAVVVYVDPLLSVVVIRTPPGTSPPIVDVPFLPAETTTVLAAEPEAVVEMTCEVIVPDSSATVLLLPVAAETAEETTEEAAAKASTET